MSLSHAGLWNLSLLLSFDAGIVDVKIEDDGWGVQPRFGSSSNRSHYGIIGMRGRAEKLGGRFLLSSAPGKGAQSPLEHTADAPGATGSPLRFIGEAFSG